LTAVTLASRLPRRLASPGFAFASWTRIGIFRLKAARYAGVDTYPPKPITKSDPFIIDLALKIAPINRNGKRKIFGEIFLGNEAFGM
jgi:hypothetical protein